MKRPWEARSFWAVILLLGLVGYGFVKRSSSALVANSSESSTEHQTINRAIKAVDGRLDRDASGGQQAAGLVVSKPESASVPIVMRQFAQASALARFADLQSRVLLDDEAKIDKQRLLTDEPFLQSLADMLILSGADNMGLQRLQNQAVDLLLEARLGGSQIAGQVLRSVVNDGQVEKESLSRSDRQAFAELKAEVLYRWSAREPAITAELPGWLPGPVSQKIWRNVLNAQEQNQLESAEEARALKKQ